MSKEEICFICLIFFFGLFLGYLIGWLLNDLLNKKRGKQ